MSDPVDVLDQKLRTFPTHVELGAQRHADGSIEIYGLGIPATGTDDQCIELLDALVEVDTTDDPDDLQDAIAQAVLRVLEHR